MRNNTLDLVKLIACGFVICLHVAGFPELPSWGQNSIFLLSRWAVPFFFIVSGYYLGAKGSLDVLKKIKKIICIYLFASLLYLSFIFVKSRFNIMTVISDGLSPSVFIFGPYFHLWFLIALIYGSLGLLFFIDNSRGFVPIVLSVIIILTCWCFDLLKSAGVDVGAFYVMRSLNSFAFMWFGILIYRKKHRIKISSSLFIIVLSSFMMVAEPLPLNYLFGFDSSARQFPLFSAPLVYGVLMLSLSVRCDESTATRIGRDYSLGVYIIHPMWIYVLYKFLPSGYSTPSILIVTLTFILCVSSLFITRKVTPKIFRLINGA
ncbi:Serine/alanine racemase [Yersinia intermedia]|uniref:acyltransferase family protein n=1 Tax=Yersinia intermedia TaxID=631 RepID=UPI0005DD259B|nr:acyltransferase [Yersinia intermedia]CNH65373.1 Serine/alanine racemase [Yersinia intermedia]